MNAPAADVARVRAQLCELDVDAPQVLADPTGRTWLPEDLWQLCRDDPACAAELAEFVEAEATLCSLSDAEPGHGHCVDPFFTARVAAALPTTWIGSRLSPYRRAMILGAFYAAAALVCWLVVTMLAPGLALDLADRAHGLLTTPSPVPWPVLATVAIAAVAAVAFVGRKSHTPVA